MMAQSEQLMTRDEEKTDPKTESKILIRLRSGKKSMAMNKIKVATYVTPQNAEQ